MPRVALLSGAYQARSVISGAQRCVNLYPESNPGDSQAPVPTTHYPTPGLTQKFALSDAAQVRCLYPCTNGELYAVCGQSVYFINTSNVVTKIGSIGSSHGIVRMRDNGLCVLIVDGTSAGYVVDLTNPARTFGKVNDPVFVGASHVDYIDTFFILNSPGTNQFYLSNSELTYAMATSSVSGTAFNPLYIVARTGGPDPIQGIVCIQREAWILGAQTSEIWIDEGTPDFPLAELPGTFVEHGCAAKYSIACHGGVAFWLSQDKDGRGVVVMTNGYKTDRISTHAIELDIAQYGTISDAVGYCYQIVGHVFYVLAFPTADATWVYEVATGQWHQWASIDLNGNFHRHRSNCAAMFNGMNLVGDWQNGIIYQLSVSAFTDNGTPIPRIRTFPHMLNDGKRVSYSSFIADLQVGTISGQQSQQSANVGDFNADFSNDYSNANYPDAAGSNVANPPKVTLRWSDTRGATWSNGVTQTIGSTGQYLTSVKFNRLGMARDRVFELSWDAPVDTALNGAFIDYVAAGT